MQAPFQIVDVRNKLFTTNHALKWCLLPYPDHPYGCPNVGKRNDCPPDAGRYEDRAYLDLPQWFVIVPFDLQSHEHWMKSRHPEMSTRQARCCLYWQGSLRKTLRTESQRLCDQNKGAVYNLCPEGMGINVIRTLQHLRIPVEVKPVHWIHKVALVYYPC